MHSVVLNEMTISGLEYSGDNTLVHGTARPFLETGRSSLRKVVR